MALRFWSTLDLAAAAARSGPMTEASQGYYAATTGTPVAMPQLRQNTACDVCVIGGGFTGLSAALHLARAGVDVAVLEAQSIGFGASGRNGGQVHPGYRKTQRQLESWLGQEHARALWRLSEEARELVLALAAQDCDLKRGLVTAAHNRRAALSLAEDTEDLRSRYGVSGLRMMSAQETAVQVGTDVYPAARMDLTGGHLHPLKLAKRLGNLAIEAGARIYEHSPVTRVNRAPRLSVQTPLAQLSARYLVLATDAFSAMLAPELAPYIAHVESFLIATEPLKADLNVLKCDAAVADTRHVLDYYRKGQDNALLFAGRERYWSLPQDIAATVRPRMLRVFPSLAACTISYSWRGTVGITRTRMPHFGRLASNIVFAHGYSGHGVALAVGGGKALAEAVIGKPEDFEVFAGVPAKKFPGGPLLRDPLVSAGLCLMKFADVF